MKMNKKCRLLCAMLFVRLVAMTPLGQHVQPVIGILTLPPSSEDDGVNLSLIDSSYVKYLEMGGAGDHPLIMVHLDLSSSG